MRTKFHSLRYPALLTSMNSRNANILYIDQPVMAGFSYSSLINGTFDLLDQGLITPLSEQSPPPQVNTTFGYGTFPSQKFQLTANTTVQAGKALWHFSENWLSSFPGYRTASNKISIWVYTLRSMSPVPSRLHQANTRLRVIPMADSGSPRLLPCLARVSRTFHLITR
jgi:hypothetical protein